MEKTSYRQVTITKVRYPKLAKKTKKLIESLMAKINLTCKMTIFQETKMFVIVIR